MMAVRRRVSQALHVLAATLTVAAFWWLVIRAASPPAGPAAGEQGACTKHTVVGFLKTHKCASSSVQNIFMRFGLKNELNFALPMSGNYVGRYYSIPYHTMEHHTLPYHTMQHNTIPYHTIEHHTMPYH